MNSNDLAIANLYNSKAAFLTCRRDCTELGNSVQTLIDVVKGELFWALVELRDIADNTHKLFASKARHDASEASEVTAFEALIDASEARLEKLLAA